MAGKEPDTGPTAAAVATNVERLREQRGLTYTQLSERLKTVAGWSISPIAVRRIEDRQRRITVDDLAALAVALGVTPVTLLMPDSADADTPAPVTGLGWSPPAAETWDWLTARPARTIWDRITTYNAGPASFLAAYPTWYQHQISEQTIGMLAADGTPTWAGGDGDS